MVFGLFKKKDPICGMKEEKGKGITEHGEWFCSKACLGTYEKNKRAPKKEGCCGNCEIDNNKEVKTWQNLT